MAWLMLAPLLLALGCDGLAEAPAADATLPDYGLGLATCKAGGHVLGGPFAPEPSLGNVSREPIGVALDVIATFDGLDADGYGRWQVEGPTELPPLRVPDALRVGASYRVVFRLDATEDGGIDHGLSIFADGALLLTAARGSLDFVAAQLAAAGLDARWQPRCLWREQTCYAPIVRQDLVLQSTSGRPPAIVAPGAPGVIDVDGRDLSVRVEAAVDGRLGAVDCQDVPFTFAWVLVQAEAAR